MDATPETVPSEVQQSEDGVIITVHAPEQAEAEAPRRGRSSARLAIRKRLASVAAAQRAQDGSARAERAAAGTDNRGQVQRPERRPRPIQQSVDLAKTTKSLGAFLRGAEMDIYDVTKACKVVLEAAAMFCSPNGKAKLPSPRLLDRDLEMNMYVDVVYVKPKKKSRVDSDVGPAGDADPTSSDDDLIEGDSVLRCMVCQGHARKALSRHCSPCYCGVYNDICKVLTVCTRKGKRIMFTGEESEDLNMFIRELRLLPRGCKKNNDCDASAYQHNTDSKLKCTRCRTAACVRLRPKLCHDLLRKGFSKAIVDSSTAWAPAEHQGAVLTNLDGDGVAPAAVMLNAALPTEQSPTPLPTPPPKPSQGLMAAGEAAAQAQASASVAFPVGTAPELTPPPANPGPPACNEPLTGSGLRPNQQQCMLPSEPRPEPRQLSLPPPAIMLNASSFHDALPPPYVDAVPPSSYPQLPQLSGQPGPGLDHLPYPGHHTPHGGMTAEPAPYGQPTASLQSMAVELLLRQRLISAMQWQQHQEHHHHVMQCLQQAPPSYYAPPAP